MSDLDLSQSIRDGLLAEPAIVSALPVYGSNGKTIFTRRPVPSDAPYPMIVISPDVSMSDSFVGINDDRPTVVRDVSVYGKNEPAAAYRQVEEIAYAVRNLFHRQRHSLLMDSDYSIIDVSASGPRPAPTDDQQTVGRMVELTVRLAKGPPPPVLPYVASAVHFDGNAGLSRSNLLTSSGNGLLSFSGWRKFDFLVNRPYLFVHDVFGANAVFAQVNQYGDLFVGYNFGGLPILTLDFAGVIVTGQWYHVMFSLNISGGSAAYAVYLNDVLLTPTAVDYAGPATFDWTRPLYFDSDTGTVPGGWFAGDAADDWLAPGVSLLSAGAIPVADRRKFISDSGKPAYPSGFPPRAVLFSGDAAHFGINQGTGGGFTLTGSLTNASSSPSN